MLDGYKTYLAGISAFLIALAGAINEFITGQDVNYNLVVASLIALAILFLRHGIKKEGVKNE